MSEIPKNISGVVFNLESLGRQIGGREFYAPPLTYLALRKLQQLADKSGFVSLLPYFSVIRGLQIYKLRAEKFDVITAYEDLRKLEPDPEKLLDRKNPLRYSKIVNDMGFGDEPRNVVAFEATLDGAEAASSAGCFVVGLILDHTHKEFLEAGADLTAPSYFSAETVLERFISRYVPTS